MITVRDRISADMILTWQSDDSLQKVGYILDIRNPGLWLCIEDFSVFNKKKERKKQINLLLRLYFA